MGAHRQCDDVAAEERERESWEAVVAIQHRPT